MTQGIEIRPVDAPGGDERVCHYDQLAEGLKGRFPRLVPDGEERTTVESESVTSFRGYDVVKYTRYYRISPAGGPAAGD